MKAITLISISNMSKFLFLMLFFAFGVSFADSSPTVIELKADNKAFSFVSEGKEGSANSGMTYEAANWLCLTTEPAHGYPAPIPELRSKFVGFDFSKKSLATPEGAGGGFCRYAPINAVVYLTGVSLDGSRPLVAQLEIYNKPDSEERVIEIFCKVNIEYGTENLRCRNTNEPYPNSASRIFLNISAGVSTIIVHQE